MRDEPVRDRTTYRSTGKRGTRFFRADDRTIATRTMRTVIVPRPDVTILRKQTSSIRSISSTYTKDAAVTLATNTVLTNGTTLTRDEFEGLKDKEDAEQ